MNPNPDEQDLTRRLEAAVPEAPSALGWADGARHRHRRTRRLQVAGAAAAAAVVVGGVALGSVVGAENDRDAGPASDPNLGTPFAVEVGCPEPGTPLEYPGDSLPEDRVVAAQLCRGDRAGDLPEYEVYDGVADVVRFVNEAPSGADLACTRELGPSYALWFFYADGTRSAVRVEDYGCGFVYRAEGEPLRGGAELLELVGELAEGPRQESTEVDPDLAASAQFFLSFASPEDIGWGSPAPVALYLGHQPITMLASTAINDEANWRICPPEGGYAGYACPVSALEWVADHPVAIHAQEPDLVCADPPPFPAELDRYRRLSLYPPGENTCADGGAVTLFFDSEDRIVAVDLTLNEP